VDLLHDGSALKTVRGIVDTGADHLVIASDDKSMRDRLATIASRQSRSIEGVTGCTDGSFYQFYDPNLSYLQLRANGAVLEPIAIRHLTVLSHTLQLEKGEEATRVLVTEEECLVGRDVIAQCQCVISSFAGSRPVFQLVYHPPTRESEKISAGKALTQILPKFLDWSKSKR
jgi:hypothetical protein